MEALVRKDTVRQLQNALDLEPSWQMRTNETGGNVLAVFARTLNQFSAPVSDR